MGMKLKKTKKMKGERGQTNQGHGARKKAKKSGHKGGVGMAGTGKKADHKKTLVNKLYGNKYFGKQGITSKGTLRDKGKKINLRDIEKNLDNLKKKFGKGDLLDLSDYKILAEGELKSKLKIKAKEVSEGARKKIEEAGGSVEVSEKKDTSTGNLKNDNEVSQAGEDSSDVISDTKIIEEEGEE